jgi:type II secretory pathway predicted ATPase ExeA
MLRAFYGIDINPFSIDDSNINLLLHQQEIFDVLKVHSFQGGLCMLMGEPGTGKTVIKTSVMQNADKTTIVVNVGRTLHTYFNTVKILCHAFNTDHEGSSFKCEKRLIEEAYNINNHGKSIIVIIDDAHLMDMNTLRRLRLLFDDFPKNHNIILVGQTQLLHNIAIKANEDIKSRVSYSVILKKLNPDDMEKFIISQLDNCGLGHNTFTENAMALIVRSADGILRKAKNLCLSCLVEAVRSKKKIIDIDNVNRVLIQPHWRIEKELEYLL